MMMRNKLAFFAAAGITFVLHTLLQWSSWALADGVGHAHPLPFFFFSFPVLWLAPKSVQSFELLMALNSAIWAGVVGLLVMWVQRRKRTRQPVVCE